MVAAKRLTATDDQLIQLEQQQWTRADIARAFSISLTAVSKRYKALGRTRERPRYAQLLPWQLTPEHSKEVIPHRLRWLGRADLNTERGRDRWADMPPWAEGMVQELLNDLVAQSAVIDYDRERGFYLTPATPKELRQKAIVRQPS